MGSLGNGNVEEAVANGSSPLPAAFNITRIAVIGAGPSGLAAAKHLLAEGFSASQVDIYEQQAEVGGVWNYSAATAAQPLRVPQTDAHAAPDPPIRPEDPDRGEKDEYEDYEFDSDEEACTAPGSGACSLPPASQREKRPPVFPNPMYDDLHTNIPHTLMRYSDLGFTAGGEGKGTHVDCDIFPTRQVVQEYLLQYAQDVWHLIRFSSQVTNVSLQQQQPPPSTTLETDTQEQPQVRDKWTVRSTNLLTDIARTEIYDAVVVASGHYSAPYIPAPAPEMAAFAAAHPGVISHSKTYRAASAFAGKRVVLVGSGPSGVDIASQISAVCAPPLILSARSPVSDDMAAHLGVGGDRVRAVGPIVKFLIDERGVEVRSAPANAASSETEGGESSVERILDVDAILFCTGYLYTFPFFSASSFPPSTPALVAPNERRVRGVARHFLHAHHPTLVFPGLPIKIIPFPLAEAQAAVFARLWANRLPLPPREALRAWEREDEAGAGFEGPRVPGKPFHTFPKGGDARYINALHDWAARAQDGNGKGEGKEPPFWGDEELWQRSIYAEAKIRFEKTGRTAKSLQELGFQRETSV
ncbi:putative thiol-specific monooxygenase [Rosellinia necatrix]|uniref:Putative thiol-specific monooxygenase n=1 Tax=Rosellinia necatrix TaxID=77044 RepID=A0A1W2THK5_ROSNE|nr:putative thiol-specific monooxygenase [Rosellinia necatrix]